MLKSFFLLLFLLFSFESHASFKLTKNFGNQGIIELNPSRGDDRGEIVRVDDSGHPLVAITSNFNRASDAFLCRLMPSGKSDVAFGEQGCSELDLGGKEYVYGMELQKDGKIVLAGFVKRKFKQTPWVARFLPSGIPDTAFGKNGVVELSVVGKTEIHYLAIQNDEKIILTGFIERKFNKNFLLMRFLANGTLDSTFANQGVLNLDSSVNDRFYGVAIDSNQKIVAVGSVQKAVGDDECIVTRFLPSGKMDHSFGNRGTVMISAGPYQDVCSSILVEGSHYFVTGFLSSSKNDSDIFVREIDNQGNIIASSSSKWGRGGVNIGHDLSSHAGQIYLAGESPASEKGKYNYTLLSVGRDMQAASVLPSFTGNNQSVSAASFFIKGNSIWVTGFAEGKVILVKYSL